MSVTGHRYRLTANIKRAVTIDKMTAKTERKKNGRVKQTHRLYGCVEWHCDGDVQWPKIKKKQELAISTKLMCSLYRTNGNNYNGIKITLSPRYCPGRSQNSVPLNRLRVPATLCSSVVCLKYAARTHTHTHTQFGKFAKFAR